MNEVMADFERRLASSRMLTVMSSDAAEFDRMIEAATAAGFMPLKNQDFEVVATVVGGQVVYTHIIRLAAKHLVGGAGGVPPVSVGPDVPESSVGGGVRGYGFGMMFS